ncbi:Stress response protein NhaX [Devosia equisanguinis]|uniref:Stress response protein NhaX n=1 Tax=Devosia equisanguinis TaxID=2490941 RepID=A0A3S4CBI0_9HYPH|nr:universal stress protein [Devosia equisanguinis]VDS04461.1 Stress response protein NhaX [Devosia equisanguinis]
MFKTLLIATDGSELAAKALDAAIELAKLHGSSLIILTTTDPVGTSIGAGGFGAIDAAPIIARLDETYTAEAKKLLDGAKALAGEHGIPAETVHVPHQRPADGIIDTARARNVDTIIMGSHGRRGLGRLILGSQAAEVLARADVPVLVVK